MNWIDILKATFRPADEPLSPSPRDFLTKPEEEGVAGSYNLQDGTYTFDLRNQTPEQIAQVISEETTHHAQNVIGNMDEDYRRYYVNLADQVDLLESYTLPLVYAKISGNESEVRNVLGKLINTLYSNIFGTIVSIITVESHAKESQNLEPFDKLNVLFPLYIIPTIRSFFSVLSNNLRYFQLGEHFDVILPYTEEFKTKLGDYCEKVVEDVVTETLKDRKRKAREAAVARIKELVDTTKKEARNVVITFIEDLVNNMREELNA